MNKILKDFKELLYLDNVTIDNLETTCKNLYRLNSNPLPSIRQWLKRNFIPLPVHYFKSNCAPTWPGSILNKVCRRASPLLIVEVVKIIREIEKVNIYFISGGKILNREHFNIKEN